jgi:hypothetical protein
MKIRVAALTTITVKTPAPIVLPLVMVARTHLRATLSSYLDLDEPYPFAPLVAARVELPAEELALERPQCRRRATLGRRVRRSRVCGDRALRHSDRGETRSLRPPPLTFTVNRSSLAAGRDGSRPTRQRARRDHVGRGIWQTVRPSQKLTRGNRLRKTRETAGCAAVSLCCTETIRPGSAR